MMIFTSHVDWPRYFSAQEHYSVVYSYFVVDNNKLQTVHCINFECAMPSKHINSFFIVKLAPHNVHVAPSAA